MAWAKRLMASGVADNVRFHVSRDYTGVVLEVLALGSRGQVFLLKDHTEVDYGPNGPWQGRTVFMMVAAACRFHAKRPLIRTSGGNVGAFYRLADDGEDAPVDLELPALVPAWMLDR